MRSDEGMGNRCYAGPDDVNRKPVGEEEEEIDPVSFPIVDPQTDTNIDDDDEPVSFPIVDPQPDTKIDDDDEPVSFPIVDPQTDNTKDSGS